MLTEKQLKGCWMLAQGRTHKAAYEAAGVAEKTFYRWLKKPDFQAALEILSEQRLEAESASATAEADLNSVHSSELATLEVQREIVKKLGELNLELIKQIVSDGVENLSPRQYPSFAKAFADAVAALQSSNDRLIGLESLIQDVESLEKTIQERAEAIDSGESP